VAELADATGLGPVGRKPLEVRLLSPAYDAPVSGFTFVHRERVRFRDCDPMGHVNNAVYSTYLEQARIGVLGGLSEFILARVEIDFRAELRAGEEIEVRTRCERVGTKSFDLEHELRTDGRVVAEARSVLVAYDYEQGRSIEVPDAVRARLLAPAPAA
jgi:acyl-CoA thioester hydrolase